MRIVSTNENSSLLWRDQYKYIQDIGDGHDALVMHGPGDDWDAFGGIRAAAMESAPTPAQHGDEMTYLRAFLDAGRAVMLSEPDHPENVDRIETEQRRWLEQGNLELNTPLRWVVNGQGFSIG